MGLGHTLTIVPRHKLVRCEFSLAFAPDELMSRDNASVRSMRCRRNVDCTIISLGLNLLHDL
jgi:hypothetical protein